MKIHVEHRKISGKFSLTRAMSNLASLAEGALLLKSLKDEASRQLLPFGIESLDFLDIGEQEILVCPDGRAMVAVELVHRGEQRYLQIVVIFGENSAKDALLELLSQIPQLEGKAIRGSVRDAMQVRRMERLLSKLSPNGQKLADPTSQSILPKLFDLKTREIVHDIYETYQEALVPIFLLNKSEALARNPEVTNKVLDDVDLFTKKYGIGCQKCEEGYMLPLVYESKEAAQAALDSSENPQCPLCHESLIIGEAISLRDVAWQGEQGLWLEYLVYSIAKDKAVAAFAGRMAGLHELDVVAVLGEDIILFECKDTALGHNDPIVTAGKAQAIGASKVFTITTKHIHDNVKQAVKELTRPSSRGFQLEQAEETAEIRSKIISFFEDIERNYFRQISGQHEPRGLRRFLIHRPPPIWEEETEF